MVRESGQNVLRGYVDLIKRQHKIIGFAAKDFEERGLLANELGRFYKTEIVGREDILDMPLKAATLADDLGTLAGTLVVQRTLELFRYEFPVLSSIFTDFSDQPGVFNQTEITRIIVSPSVQEYDSDADTDGRPKGWDTVVAAATTDVNVKLDKHVSVPIVYDANTLASTIRRLFDEQAGAQLYALSKYMVDKIYTLFLAATYNKYATVSAKVPSAYATFPVALAEMARGRLVELSAAFTMNEVPVPNRFLLLNCAHYGKLSTDPSLTLFFATQGASELLTMNRLPKIATFVPIEAPNLPTTGGMVGMALHKAGAIIKARLPNDYTTVFGSGASNGLMTTITAPDIGLSMMLVQFSEHVRGFAEQRTQVMLGAAAGDPRGGLVITGA